MRLVAQSAKPAPFEPKTLDAGSGYFEMSAGANRTNTRLGIHYYKPAGLTPDSPILIIIPGAGRNADSYRDAWISEAERANVLIAAPVYPEHDYDIASYQMGGVIKNLEIQNLPTGANGEMPAHIYLQDEDIQFSVNSNTADWIFHDFDRLFTLLATQTGSRRIHYDLFGHSAGAQVLHRHILFNPHSHADRVIAANAGLYTLPDMNRPPLLGLAGTGMTEEDLRASLSKKLIIMAGENDTYEHSGGMLLHTPLIDQTGADRLARAHYFYNSAQDAAARLHVDLAWTLSIVPDTGHDYRAMSLAAARLLFPS
jgi:hypothetical protein